MAEVQDAWERRDLAGYVSHWSAEADVVNRGGQSFHGLVAAEQQWRRLFDRGFPEVFAAQTEVTGVRLISPEVAVVHQVRRESTRESIAVYVLARTAGPSGESDGGSGRCWRVETLTIAPVGQGPRVG